MENNITYSTLSNKLLSRVYALMTVGLGLTALVAYYVSTNQRIINLVFKNFGLLIILFLLQLGLVFALSFFLNKMSSTLAMAAFLAYSILNGITLATIFIVYVKSSIAIAFFVTAGMFAAMALYGYITKADLSGMGSILFMGLIGLIIAMVVNIFLKSQSFNYLISAIGVIIFSLLTAYDVQQIKLLGQQLIQQGQSLTKASIIGALKLYLDFINLFLFILQFVGKKREQ